MNNSGASLYFNVTTAMDHMNEVHDWLAEHGISPLDEDTKKPAYMANLVGYRNDTGLGEVEFLFFNVNESFSTLFILRWGNQKEQTNNV